MQNITSLKVTNRKPIILVTHECLEAIKHIVSIAPQEAQWFHTIDVHESSNSNNVYLKLSDKLYIPKQNTSAAQVDSSSSMMIEFYNELKQEYNDQSVINDKLTNMTCWCHSHHNMAPSPSGQDQKQFADNVKMAMDQDLSTWQIMLIFNKQDKFYSKVRDPLTGLIFEGVDIVVSHNYDFNYIDQAAKTKFLKPKPKFTSTFGKYNNSLTNKTGWASWSNKSSLSTSYDKELEDRHNTFLNESIANDIISSIQFDSKNLSTISDIEKASDATAEISFSLSEKEFEFLYHMLQNKPMECLNIFTDKRYKKNALSEEDVYSGIINYFLESNQTIETFRLHLISVLDLTDLNTLAQAKDYLEQI